MTNANAGELLTVSEVASALRISEMTVRRHIAAGRLQAVRCGHCWRVSRAAVDVLVMLGTGDMTPHATVTLNTKDNE